MTAPSIRRSWPRLAAALSGPLQMGVYLLAALILFAFVLVLAGKDPILAYADVVRSTLTSSYGLSEVIVKMTPLLFCALAVAIPARIGLVNVGSEGQMWVGALCATWAALSFPSLPPSVLLPLMAVLGFIGGGLWGAVCGYLRARNWINEVFSTLLLNYVAILLVSFLVFGPWRDPGSGNYPQTPEFAASAQLPFIITGRIHLGIVIAIVALIGFYLVMRYTHWGLSMRAMGSNPEAARRIGVRVATYSIVAMMIGGGIAGLGGMAEVSAIQHRLNPGLSPGFGYIGFLISWIAGHRPLTLPVMAFLLAVIFAGGDILQITQGLPYAVLNILMGLILFVVLAARAVRRSSM